MSWLRYCSTKLQHLCSPLLQQKQNLIGAMTRQERSLTFGFRPSLVQHLVAHCLPPPNAWLPVIGRLLPPPVYSTPLRQSCSLMQMHLRGPHFKKRNKRRPLDGNPQMKGVVLKTLIKKPKKPNSANRKCVLVRLSNGKEMVAHVPGEGHNLQEHNVVLTRCGRLQDVPGVKIKVIRGKYDCAPVKKKTARA